jgi:uncharacterized membrane protein
MSNLTEFLIYLGVIFLGILTILLCIIAYFVVKFYNSSVQQNKIVNIINQKIEKIQKEFKDFKDKLVK